MKTRFKAPMFAILLLAVTTSWAANTYKVLHYFGQGYDGWAPEAALVMDSSGNLYGTTTVGGLGCLSPGCGIIFELQPSADGTWSEKVLRNLNRSEGTMSHAPLVFDAQGNLYGTTSGGGSGDQGTVLELIPDASGIWKTLVLHSFTGGWDGGNPYGGVLLDNTGRIYGVTSAGGPNNVGVVFALNGQSVGPEVVLRSFTGGSDGGSPMSAMIADASGNLYGTTYTGGPSGSGTVFKLTPNQRSPGWACTVLYAFHCDSVWQWRRWS